MYNGWRAFVGFAVVSLVTSVAGPRMHVHAGDRDDFDRPVRALVHTHGAGEPHSHETAPSPAGEQSEQHDPVIVLGATRMLLPASSAVPLMAPLFLPEPATTVPAVGVWTPAPDGTPVHSHGPPSTRLLPPRAPPSGPLRIP